jgi:hypothetical protein
MAPATMQWSDICVCWMSSVQAARASCQMECDSIAFSLHFAITPRCRCCFVDAFILVCNGQRLEHLNRRDKNAEEHTRFGGGGGGEWGAVKPSVKIKGME